MVSGCRIIQNVLSIYLWILFARVALSWVTAFRPDWQPPQGLRPVLDFIYGLTDPPVNFLRRFVPPLTSGGISLDLAFLVWFFIIIILRRTICG